jgi:hypothetical protein
MLVIPGEFLRPSVPPTPLLNMAVSQNANFGIWQLAQLMVLSNDKIGSENNCSPNASGVTRGIRSKEKSNAEKKIKATNFIPQKYG